MITAQQMRELHALLRDHGITGDHATHDYINTALAEDNDPPVESRKDLTQAQAARLIRDLSAAPVAAAPVASQATLKKLRAPFPPEAIGKLPRSTCKDCSDNRGTCSRHPRKSLCRICGNYHSDSAMHIDYVGHADVTDRLLEADPAWTWRPFTADEMSALPPKLRDAGLWIMLTVLGVTRPGFGDADGKIGGNAVKEAIGDALRNAAMRFGVALDLWAKGDREWARAEKDGAETEALDPAPPRQEQPAAPYSGPTTQDLLLQIDADGVRVGLTYEQITAKMRHALGGISLQELDSLPPETIAPYADSIHTHADRVVAERGTPAA